MATNPKQKRTRKDVEEHLSLRTIVESFSGPIIFFLVIVSVIFVMSVFFRVSDVRVDGNVHYSDQEIINAIDIEEGDNLFFFDRFAALSRVFAKLPYVEEISVERSLPNKVIITVTESQALAYIVLGDENWTIDHSCKILGKANDDELSGLIPISGLKPGTLLIGENLQTEDGNALIVEFLAEVLYQLEERGMYTFVDGIDFSDIRNVRFNYGERYMINIGGGEKVEHKFGLVVSALSQLLSGDAGTIDVSDGVNVHFIPL